MVNRKRKRRIALVALLAFVLGTTAFAYAASITFNGASNAGAAGQGSGDISGYDVTNIHYTLDDNDPSNLTGVTFELSPASSRISAESEQPAMLEARMGDEQLGAVRLGHSHRFDKKLLAANTFPRSPSQHRRGGEGSRPAVQSWLRHAQRASEHRFRLSPGRSIPRFHAFQPSREKQAHERSG